MARGEPNGLAAGERVNVVPDDYGFDPVGGELVAADVHEIAVRRSSPETGEVVVHFPRAGFRVAAGAGRLTRANARLCRESPRFGRFPLDSPR